MEMNERYEKIIDLEFEVKGAAASVTCQGAGVPLYRKSQAAAAYQRAKDALGAAIDALTAEELAEFGPYRAQVYAQIAERSRTRALSPNTPT
jgi:hypothetical protein